MRVHLTKVHVAQRPEACICLDLSPGPGGFCQANCLESRGNVLPCIRGSIRYWNGCRSFVRDVAELERTRGRQRASERERFRGRERERERERKRKKEGKREGREERQRREGERQKLSCTPVELLAPI